MPLQRKIIARNTLGKKLKGTRKKVVFTNGCFDILHSGHVLYLQKAKSMGDILVVALNDNHSVRELKGPHRPVNDLKDRLMLVAALESVDYVTWFSESTPQKLIETLKPDILAKGADYKSSEIIGASFVKKHGGKVRRIPLLKGRSTTKIIKKMTGKNLPA